MTPLVENTLLFGTPQLMCPRSRRIGPLLLSVLAAVAVVLVLFLTYGGVAQAAPVILTFDELDNVGGIDFVHVKRSDDPNFSAEACEDPANPFCRDAQPPLRFIFSLPAGTITAAENGISLLTEQDGVTISDALQVSTVPGDGNNSLLIFQWFSDPRVPTPRLTNCAVGTVLRETDNPQRAAFALLDENGNCVGDQVVILPAAVQVFVESDRFEVPEPAAAILLSIAVAFTVVLRMANISTFRRRSPPSGPPSA